VNSPIFEKYKDLILACAF